MTRITNVKKRIAIVIVLCTILTLFMPAVSDASTVTDITNHWAKTTIQNWIDDDLISGYPNGTFRPDNYITRAEFMTLVNKSNDFTTTKTIYFTDVKSSDWYYSTIKIASAAGYIGGYPDGSMRPNNPITREEAATIIMKIKNLDSDEYSANIFKDDNLMKWSKGAIGSVVAEGIMVGYPDGTFKPQNNIKRAEAVVSLDRAMDLITAPDAPNVTRNDTTNTVTGMTTAMEYKLDSASWVDYRSSIFSNIDFNGDHTLLVRYAADGDIPYSQTTTLTFTEDPLTAIKSIVGTPQVGVELTAGALTPADATASYQWQRSSTKSGTYSNITGAASKRYTPVPSDEGKYLKVVATGTGDFTGKITSIATAAVLPSETITAIGAISGTPKVGTVLTAGVLTPSDANATYQWKISSTASGTYSNISGATNNKYTPVAGDVGKYIKVTATGSDGFTGTVTSAASAQVLPKDSLVSIGSIIGTAQIGVELTAGTINPSSATVSYQWQSSSSANGTYTNITGATSNKYTPKDSDLNRYLKVTATGTGSYTGTVTSTATAAVIAKIALNSMGSITGNAVVGEQLTAGTISPSNATVSYQWVISDTESGSYANISGADTNKYTIKDSDENKFIKVIVTGTSGFTGTLTSNAVQISPKIGLESIGDIIGIAKAGVELRASDILPTGATVSYQWMRSSSADGSYSTISGANSSRYTPSDNDAGKYIMVIASGTGNYTGTVTSSPTDAVALSDLAQALIDNAEEKVSEYEDALISTLEEITAAEDLREPAVTAANLVTVSSKKSEFLSRIAERDAEIALAKEALNQ